MNKQKALAKSKDPNYKQTSVYLPKILHINLTAAAAAEGKDVSDVIAEISKQWLASKKYNRSVLHSIDIEPQKTLFFFPDGTSSFMPGLAS